MNRKLLIPALLLYFSAIFMVGCSGPSEQERVQEIISQSWKLSSMTDHGQAAPMQVLIFSSFTFNKNGSYEILLGELEKGTWKISEDGKVLVTIPEGSNQQNEMDIESINENFLILVNKNPQFDQDIRMILEPML